MAEVTLVAVIIVLSILAIALGSLEVRRFQSGDGWRRGRKSEMKERRMLKGLTATLVMVAVTVVLAAVLYFAVAQFF